jgi:CRP-like cAMP-binding protein
MPARMTTVSPDARRTDPGTLDEFLSADEIAPLLEIGADAWNRMRRDAMRRLAWQFCTLRNLWTHRGRYLRDVIGYGWGGIYRSLRVGSIVTTSYRNEGHFRAGERIFGTSDFFDGAFRLPKSSAELEELVRVVNLRHHVAGVVTRHGRGVHVLPGYEADYAYVATAFVESLRAGYAACGVPPDSPRGRAIGTELCTVLYQVAGLTGLARVPRDLAAHDRFRAAYEQRLAERPPSARVRRMGQEIARRIAPLTAAMADTTVAGHVARHFDRDTRELLFPGGDVPAELEQQRAEWAARLARLPSLWKIATRSTARAAVWRRPDVAALQAAYRSAPADFTADRLIGAILLHELAGGDGSGRPLERRSIELAAGEPLIRQGQIVKEMYVVLATASPLVVLRAAEVGAESRQVATLTAPTVLGEIGMWRSQPAVATVMTREANRLDVLVIDAARFASLKEESGFRAATAAEIQRRLALNSSLVGTLLDDTVARTRSPLLASIAQLFRYLTGDSRVSLDAVVGLSDEATPAECVEALRSQVDEVIRAGGLAPELEDYLSQVVATIG